MTRRDLIIAGAIALVVIASRIPFATHELWAWDSVLYARALEHGFHVDFELGDMRPQPPGYILYLAFAALFRPFAADSNGALVLVSIVASGLGAGAVFALARRFDGIGVAVLAALGYAFNPLVWTYGEVAYPYAPLGFLSVALATLFWVAREGRGRGRWALASFAFGLLSGFRQDLGLLLGALWLWMIWARPWRQRLAGAALVGAGIVIWLIPTAILSEGLGTYLEALSWQSESVRATYSVQAQGAAALSYNVRFTLYALAWGLLGFGLLLVALVLAPVLAWLRGGRPAMRLRRKHTFFLFWLVPGLFFYVYVHIGEWGYVLSVLPALYVLIAVLGYRLVQQLRGRAVPGWRVVAAGLVIVPALVFLGTPQRFSRAALADHDRAIVDRVAYVREHFDRDQTIVLAREDFLQVRYYLPEYRAWLYDPEPYSNPAMMQKRATKATAIVIFTDGLVPRQGLDVRYVEVSPGVQLAYVRIVPGAVLQFFGDRYTVREPQGSTR